MHTLMIEAKISYGTLVDSYQSTRRHIPAGQYYLFIYAYGMYYLILVTF